MATITAWRLADEGGPMSKCMGRYRVCRATKAAGMVAGQRPSDRPEALLCLWRIVYISTCTGYRYTTSNWW